ncbi:MAG: phosphatidylglycerophosphatase A [Ectothiorhodospiraceae bacterium]|nr:phosphatidylglycerophosphatase A [Chromatiales bacterium]MCP5156939.1 phosphatidylglycerophosphatase A [Ectothiorhodospiraceae bacterium]
MLVALAGGSGLAPRAPGTFGTVAGVVVYLALAPLSLPLYLGAVAVVVAVAIWACGRAARALGVHDHPSIVADEVAGYLVTMIAAPPGWPWVLVGFVAFRVLDIAKPWPIGPIDRRVHGGLGIVADDVVAGLLALAVVQGLAALSRTLV